jgi:hypothetical protein
MNKPIPYFVILSLFLLSACTSSYTPKVQLPNTPIKQVASESYSTFKAAITELKEVFLPQ